MPTNNLYDLDLPVVGQQQCSTFFAGIDASVVCAGGDSGKAVCKGDSGGPLFVLDDNGNPVVVGVTSKGPTNCGLAGVPAIFTRVSKHAAWIARIISASDADAAARRVVVEPAFAALRAPMPIVGGIRQGGAPVRTVRPRVSKQPFKGRAAPTPAAA